MVCMRMTERLAGTVPGKRLDPSGRPIIDETVVRTDEGDFPALIESMFRDEDAVGLILVLDALTSEVLSSWRQTEGGTIEQITTIRDTRLLPTIHKLGLLCLDAILFHCRTIYQDGLERLARIYDLGRSRQLGTLHVSSPLSWTVPSKQALIQLYVIGSYATFRRRTDAICPILDLRAWHSPRKGHVPLLSHPHFRSLSSEGDLRSHFDDALSYIVNTPTSFALFFDDKNEVASSMSQFDFIVNYALWCQQERSFPNFGRHSTSRTTPIIEWLLRPEVSTALFGSFEPQCFASYLRGVYVACSQLLFTTSVWDPDEWTESILHFLRQHPQEAMQQ